ncbi:uncharacterized protein LOC141782238 [Sebastes fasciatus]|uniref:uncharacterized protein LOC141782238 n=1 Tax=Sebastes fasciatus TaxID=394691 RepID=UPI003D9E5B66
MSSSAVEQLTRFSPDSAGGFFWPLNNEHPDAERPPDDLVLPDHLDEEDQVGDVEVGDVDGLQEAGLDDQLPPYEDSEPDVHSDGELPPYEDSEPDVHSDGELPPYEDSEPDVHSDGELPPYEDSEPDVHSDGELPPYEDSEPDVHSDGELPPYEDSELDVDSDDELLAYEDSEPDVYSDGELTPYEDSEPVDSDDEYFREEEDSGFVIELPVMDVEARHKPTPILRPRPWGREDSSDEDLSEAVVPAPCLPPSWDPSYASDQLREAAVPESPSASGPCSFNWRRWEEELFPEERREAVVPGSPSASGLGPFSGLGSSMRRRREEGDGAVVASKRPRWS